MATSRVYIDNILFNWGDNLFYPPAGRKNKNALQTKKINWATALLLNKGTEIRAQIARTTRKTPEVMVKITSRAAAGKGMVAIGHHLDYISRNGLIEMEDHEGRLIKGRHDINDIKNDWGESIPAVANRREALNIIFSMAKGTPPDEIKESVREYLKEEFGGKHEYVLALHTDTDNPHVHVCIKVSPIKKSFKRLNPRKADLQRWREGFANKLRERGIDANATPRITRGVVKQPIPQYKIHQAKYQNKTLTHRVFSEAKYFNKPQTVAWGNIANALGKSDLREDRALAKEVIDFMKAQPAYNLPAEKDLIYTTTLNRNQINDQFIKHRVHLYQSAYQNFNKARKAEPKYSLRELPGSFMVQNQRSTEMLLLTNAPNIMGARHISSYPVRREGAGNYAINDGRVGGDTKPLTRSK